MSEGIVDVFEPVQIQKKHGGMASLAMGKGDCLANAVIQEHSIRATE